MDKAIALDAWRQCAAQRSGEAMLVLGQLYRTGQGVEADATIAASWFEKAVEAGSREACACLAHAHATGEGVPCDPLKAKRYIERMGRMPRTSALAPEGVLWDGEKVMSIRDRPG
jgi:TPR repeat protein